MTTNTAPIARRSASQMAADREALAQWVLDQGMAVKAPSWAKDSDIEALVKSGRIVRTVRKEYDAVSLRGREFGGVVACQRRRAYLSAPVAS